MSWLCHIRTILKAWICNSPRHNKSDPSYPVQSSSVEPAASECLEVWSLKGAWVGLGSSGFQPWCWCVSEESPFPSACLGISICKSRAFFEVSCSVFSGVSVFWPQKLPLCEVTADTVTLGQRLGWDLRCVTLKYEV